MKLLKRTLMLQMNIQWKTHTIIRGNTNTWDSPEQLQFKAKSIFASKDSQHNFHSYLTPPKSYTSSRKQLKSLKFQCAKLLVDKVFTPLAYSSMSHVIPYQILEKSQMLPLGFHTDWPPVHNRICDMPGCSDKNCDKPWMRSDSFHVDCLKGSSICRVYQSYLKREIRKLSDTAADAIFYPI